MKLLSLLVVCSSALVSAVPQGFGSQCDNAFPNGFKPGVGPTDCAQIVDPFCNPSGEGYVKISAMKHVCIVTDKMA